MRHTRNYKVIKYSDEHIHLVQVVGGEVHEECFMGRNWSRCTARPCTVADYRSGPLDGQDRTYYDGDRWTKAELRGI
jgi:hypothetical protein